MYVDLFRSKQVTLKNAWTINTFHFPVHILQSKPNKPEVTRYQLCLRLNPDVSYCHAVDRDLNSWQWFKLKLTELSFGIYISWQLVYESLQTLVETKVNSIIHKYMKHSNLTRAFRTTWIKLIYHCSIAPTKGPQKIF